jgi:hypothetical protein
MPTCSLIQFGAVLIIFFYNPIVVYPVHSTHTHANLSPPQKTKKMGGVRVKGKIIQGFFGPRAWQIHMSTCSLVQFSVEWLNVAWFSVGWFSVERFSLLLYHSRYTCQPVV